jgi:hypothetical protein
MGHSVATPLWKNVMMTLTLPKWGLGESFETPKNLELDCRGQNILPWGNLYIIGKFLKRKCRKWPRMNHSDTCITSYVWKKGRESNCKFDSRPLKVRNRPDPGVFRWSATHRWKALKESYKFASNLIPIRGLSKELWAAKVPGIQTGIVSRQFRDSSLGLPRKNVIWM